MRVEVDVTKCVGSGQCVLHAPDVFDQRDDDGLVLLLDENPPTQLQAAVRKAAVVCPATVIRLTE